MNSRHLWLLGAALVFIYLLKLGGSPLTERSEARYVGVAWEMLQSGDYLTPRYNGIKHLHKPPLFYWVTALGMRTLGTGEAAARFPTALAALGCLALTFAFCEQKAVAPGQGGVAILCLGASPFFWEMGRIAVTDMLVAMLTSLSLYTAWRVLDRGPSSSLLITFWSSLGLNFLCKGPVGPLIVALTVLPYSALRGGRLRNFRPLPGLFLASVIGLPWYLWVVSTNPGLLQYFVKFQTVDRVLSTVHQREGPFWYYLPVWLGGFLPWTPWMLAAIRKAASSARRAQNSPCDPDLFCLLWMGLPTLFFSCMGSKLPPYILPLFPPASVLIARYFPSFSRTVLAAPLAVIALASAACGAALALRPPMLAPYTHEIGFAAIWTASITIWGIWVWLRPESDTLVSTASVGMFGLLILASSAFTRLDHLSARNIARAINQTATGPHEVAMLHGYLFGLPYYLGQFVVHVEYERETQFEDSEAFRSRILPNLPAYLIKFHNEARERFLIVRTPELGNIPSFGGESLIYQDEDFSVLHHPARPLR